MIPALSPLLNLLAPKASSTPVGGSAAFGLVLAEVGGSALGRQTAVPTGNGVPPAADLLSPTPARVLSPDEQPAVPQSPVPTMPVVMPIVSPRPSAALPKLAAWPRFAQPETCADPETVPDPPVAAGEPENTDPGRPVPPTLVIEPETLPVIGRAPETDDPEQASDLEKTRAPDLRPDPDPLGGPVAIASAPSVVAADPGRDPPIARFVDDEPGPSLERLPEPAPVRLLVQSPTVPPVAAPAMPVIPSAGPEIADPRIAVVPPSIRGAREVVARPEPAPDPAGAAPAPPATVPASRSGPARAAAADRFQEPLTVPSRRPALSSEPEQKRAADPVAPTPERMTVLARPALPVRPSIDIASAPMPAAPPRFAGSPFRPLIDGETPAAQPIAAVPVRADPPAATGVTSVLAPAVPTAPTALQVTPVLTGRASPSPEPTERLPEMVTSPTEPRPDAPKPPSSERLPSISVPVATTVSVPMTPRAVTSGPARQVFAADLRRPVRDARTIAGETIVSPLEPARLDAATVAAVPAAAPLDLRQDRWPSAMVERIERLRDAVESERIGADTRIRLIPDALGSIDVAVKRDGDTVHVHFTAEQAATRALLQDAAPRLAEAAEARGLKLGQTGVGDGGSQPNGRQPQPNTAPVSARPRSASAMDEDAADTRIA